MKMAAYKWVRTDWSWIAVDERKVIQAEITENGERTDIQASALGFGNVQILGNEEDAKSLIEEHMEGRAVFEQNVEGGKPTPPGLLKVTGE